MTLTSVTLHTQDSDVAIGAFTAQQPGGVKPVAEVVPYEDTKLVDGDKFLTAFDHSNNMSFILVVPSNASQPYLAIWPGHGSDVHIVPNLDPQLRQLVSIDWIPAQGLIATNFTHILKIDTKTGSYETLIPLSDHDLQNGAHTTTDGTHLYAYLHDGDQYYIATVNFSVSPASISLSLPCSIQDHTFVAMHWSFKYDCLVAMRTSAGVFQGMEVGNQSSLDAAEFQKVKEIIGPHYSDCGRPLSNAATFVSGDWFYAALKCSDESGREASYLTFIDMPSHNPKVIEEQNFESLYVSHRFEAPSLNCTFPFFALQHNCVSFAHALFSGKFSSEPLLHRVAACTVTEWSQ